ncbi:hypothetical protein [Actinomycetospora termitidis]|uniref:Uncharacterized protein n=1 Tax=Actinomycetospora termitidis TaxID=3053470 RepID=A0ABT7M6G8_9PSEU|nr:hypothetical protein [Actinomycetospora sp. Odt1-22]MDL5156265.1 hypothetical protein [Actinomycetospora sp. Odt1-22]
MNRVAVHHSVLDPSDPVACVLAARAGGLDAVGLHVAAEPGAERAWEHGAGAPLLAALVDALLVTRIGALDVGRVDLGVPAGTGADDPRRRSLDLAARLGAQFVTARAATDGDPVDTADALASLAVQAEPFRVRPVLVPTPGTAVADPHAALAAVRGTRAGVVLDVVPSAADPEAVAELIVEAGDALGYVRVPADELGADMGDATSLLATLPPWVPVVVGAPRVPPTPRDPADPITPARAGAFLAACRVGVDRLLIHPRALAAERGQ